MSKLKGKSHRQPAITAAQQQGCVPTHLCREMEGRGLAWASQTIGGDGVHQTDG